METIERDYTPQGVQFYYLYKQLAHPELDHYVDPYTLGERLLHVEQAERQLGSRIPWIADAMTNALKHALGDMPNSEFIIDQDVSVISFFPHMHVRGVDMDLIANYPNGESRSLINVPKYDFDWQLFYYPERPVSLPSGTRLDIVAHYDNSAANPNNPDPNRAVGFGLETSDEMMFNVFEFIADAGVSPTPATDETRRDALLASLPAGSTFSVDLPTHPMAQQFMRLGPDPLPTVLHLPTSGHGTWYIPLLGGLQAIPAENIVWDGDAYNFDMKLRLFGRFNADFAVSGEVDADGRMQGAPETPSTGFSPFQAFTGTRASAEN